MAEQTVTQIIEAVTHKVALQELNVKRYVNLYHWKKNNRFPANKLRLVEAMCKKHGLPKPSDKLFSLEAAE